MARQLRSTVGFTFSALVLGLFSTLSAARSAAQERAWLTHSHDAQHTGVSEVASQPFGKIHWSVPVDLAVPTGEIFIHYGSPVVTAENTVIVPVKTGTDSFRVEAHDGATGKLLWRQKTGYQAPMAGFLPGMGPTLFQNRPLHSRQRRSRHGATNRPNRATGEISHLYFYGQQNFQANPTSYEQSVQINTPLTVDAHGNLFFGFLAVGPTPIGLQSGLARIAADGTGTWASAAF